MQGADGKKRIGLLKFLETAHPNLKRDTVLKLYSHIKQIEHTGATASDDEPKEFDPLLAAWIEELQDNDEDDNELKKKHKKKKKKKKKDAKGDKRDDPASPALTVVDDSDDEIPLSLMKTISQTTSATATTENKMRSQLKDNRVMMPIYVEDSQCTAPILVEDSQLRTCERSWSTGVD